MGAAALTLALGVAGCGGNDAPASGAAGTTATLPAAEKGGRMAKDGDTVAVHYRGTLDDGTEFDSSEGREPISFTVGSNQVIPGFSDAVRGLKVGDENTVRLEPARAYGERREDLVIIFPPAQALPGMKPGDHVQMSNGQQAVVLAVDATGVTVDANHALAGKALTFEVELVSIK
jgi:FKBP-type peptidyl-prolyl cis-trans isomerase 2